MQHTALGHAADTDLNTGTILDFGCDAPCHYAVNLARVRVGQLRAWLMISLDNEIDLVYMNAVLFAEYIWHLTIDLDDHQLRTFNDGPQPHIGRAKVEVSTSSIGQVLRMAMSTGSRKRR